MPSGFKELGSKGKVCEPVAPQRGEGSNRQQGFQHETGGGARVEKKAEYEADVKGYDHKADETTRTTPAPSGLLADSSSEGSNSELDPARSPHLSTKPRKATTRNCEGVKSLEEPELELRNAGIATRRSTKQSTALNGMKLDPPVIMDGDDNKWKHEQGIDGCVNA